MLYINLLKHLYVYQELHEPAVKAGVTMMNEIGLDPGIDHMLAMQCFDEVHNKGGKVRKYQYTLFVLQSTCMTLCLSL